MTRYILNICIEIIFCCYANNVIVNSRVNNYKIIFNIWYILKQCIQLDLYSFKCYDAKLITITLGKINSI